MKRLTAVILIALGLTPCNAWSKGRTRVLGALTVSSNGHGLTLPDGTPFFYLADTAWELFHRTTREEADMYLRTRAAQGFNVIQAVLLSELDGTGTPNAEGYLPLRNDDVLKPDTVPGLNNDYWDQADSIIRRANQLGLYVALLPSWGSYWHDSNVINEHNAQAYGRFLGQRYKDCAVMWILGGDRPIDNDQHMQVLRNLARGLREGGARQLITFHPSGANGSSTWMQQESWLDLHMRQNGHTDLYTGHYSRTLDDFRLTPSRPVIDGESTYEDHPIDFQPQRYGYSTAQDVRHAFYWDVMNGACGHTYGHHSVWQFYNSRRTPVNHPLLTWQEAMQQPGACQMQYGRRLIESRPMQNRIPRPELIVAREPSTGVPGEGRYRMVACGDAEGTYGMIYTPTEERAFAVDMSLLRGERIRVWWYNPRTGKAHKQGTLSNPRAPHTFVPLQDHSGQDWVLVLDDAACHYPAPGSKSLHC